MLFSYNSYSQGSTSHLKRQPSQDEWDGVGMGLWSVLNASSLLLLHGLYLGNGMGIILLGIYLMYRKMHEHIQLHMEHLSWDVAQLWQRLVQWSQWQNWAAKAALLLAALQHWRIWAFPEVFVLLFGFLWCLRKTKYLPGSSSITWICTAILSIFLKPFFFTKVARMLAWGSRSQKRSRNKEENDDEEENSDSDETWNLGRVWADSTEWPAPYKADKCQLVEELVDDLLRTC